MAGLERSGAGAGLDLEWIAGRYAICRLAAHVSVPEWAAGAFLTVSRTPEELSIVCAWETVPAGVRREGPYALLRVSGTLVITLTGILASLATPLAEAGVPIFALSTFDTDYLLVAERDRDRAQRALAAAGHRLAAP